MFSHPQFFSSSSTVFYVNCGPTSKPFAWCLGLPKEATRIVWTLITRVSLLCVPKSPRLSELQAVLGEHKLPIAWALTFKYLSCRCLASHVIAWMSLYHECGVRSVEICPGITSTVFFFRGGRENLPPICYCPD